MYKELFLYIKNSIDWCLCHKEEEKKKEIKSVEDEKMNSILKYVDLTCLVHRHGICDGKRLN